MKKILLLFTILFASLSAVSVQAQEKVYSVDFSYTQAGWGCVTYTGKPWAYSQNCFYDYGTYYSGVTMARNYAGASTARYLSPAIHLAAGTYRVRTLALKDGGAPTVHMGYTPATSSSAVDEKEIAQLTLGTRYAEDARETHLISITEECDYYFYFDGATQATDYHTPFLFTFEVLSGATGGGEGGGTGGGETGGGESGGQGDLGKQIYAADLTNAAERATWKAVDTNGDGTTWAEGDNCLQYNGMFAAGAANDLLISPAIAVESGKDYKITAEFLQSAAFDPDQITVFGGMNENPDLYLGSLEVYAASGSGTAVGNFRFHANASGNAHFGIRLTGQDANGILALKAFTLTVIEAAHPNPPADFKAVSNPDTQKVTLSWTNPTHDTQGMELVQPLGVRLYENGTLIKEYTNAELGQACTFVFSPTLWSGSATYRIVSYIGYNESVGQEETINLEDNKGDEVEVVSFADVNRKTFADWYTESITGNSVWAFGYQNVIQFIYYLGQKENDWLITPGFTLKKNTRYLLRYELQTQLAYCANVAVTLGTAQHSSAHSRVLQEHGRLFQNGFGPYNTPQFTVEADGTYYIGFHVTEAECTVAMRNLKVYEIKKESTAIEPLLQEDLEEVRPATPEIYSLDGRRLARPMKGVNIVNGKKVIY